MAVGACLVGACVVGAGVGGVIVYRKKTKKGTYNMVCLGSNVIVMYECTI